MKLGFALVFCGTLLWTGYSRRKSFWTARSWRSFGVALGSAICAAMLSLVMAQGVDQGVYEVLSPFTESVYFFTMFALLVVSGFSIPLLLVWFAAWEPGEQFGWRSGNTESAPS